MFTLLLLTTGVKVWWSLDTAVVTEGEMISISLMLDREPGVQFNVSVYATNINTTG